MLSRRSFLKRSLLAGASLTIGCSLLTKPVTESEQSTSHSISTQYLSQEGVAILAAIVPVMLADIRRPKESEIEEVILAIDETLRFMPPHIRNEIELLLSLLNNSFSRILLTGIWSNWQEADSNAVAAFLDDWKSSSINSLRIGYKGIRDLAYGAWYAVTVYGDKG